MPVYLRIYVATILPSVIFTTLYLITTSHPTDGMEGVFKLPLIMGTFYMVVIGGPLQTLFLGSLYERYRERAEDYYIFIKLFVIGIFYTAITAFFCFGLMWLSVVGYIIAPIVALVFEWIFLIWMPRAMNSEHFMNSDD